MPRALHGRWLLPSLIVLALVTQLASGRTADAIQDTFTVNFAGDHAPNACQPFNLFAGTDCTLREAIIAANADPGFTTINFNVFPNGSPAVITVNSEGQGVLPPITTAMEIDGTTDPDGRPSITQTGLPSSANSDGFKVNHDGVVIRGLAIYGFPSAGIEITSNQVHVMGNYIGTNAAGSAAGPGNGFGVMIVGPDAYQNFVGDRFDVSQRNIISGNGTGIRIDNAGQDNHIWGNFIGTNAAGTSAIPNNNGVVIVNTSAAFIGWGSAALANTISGNTFAGVHISGANASGNKILGNYIGTNALGTAAVPNGSGVTLYGASGNDIGGTTPGERNVISGNLGYGVYVHTDAASGDASSNNIVGNYIGVSADGAADLGNSSIGIYLWAADQANTIDFNRISGNVSSGNVEAGILIEASGGSSAVGNSIQANFVGTNAAGTAAIPNTGSGIELVSTSAGGFVSNTVVGGATPDEGNLVSGNAGSGLVIRGASAIANTVENNNIGLDVTGTAALGNSFFGIRIAEGANFNHIGTPGAGNIIASNGTGIRIGDNTTTGNLIQGNFIGTNAGLDTGLGNINEGVYISNAAGNIIGGDMDGTGNVIAHNGTGNPDASGVRIQDADALGNRIWRNSIHSNANLGIQLDAGANNAQEAPVLSSAENGSTHVIGALDSAPNTAYRIEFFANTTCDPSGSGEGQTFLGFADVTTDGAGHAVIDVTLPAAAAPGDQITATATDPGGNTSPFSQCVLVTGAATPTPTPTPSPTPPGQTPTPIPTPTPTPTPTPPGQTPSPSPSTGPTPTPSNTPKPTGSPVEHLQGDVNCDTRADSVDALLILRDVAHLPSSADCLAEAGDVNCDGSRTAVDALGVLRYVAHLEVAQPDTCPNVGTPL